MEAILSPELTAHFEVPAPWVPAPGNIAVNFGQTVRIVEIGYTDSFGEFHPDMILVKIIGFGEGIGEKYYANIKFLKPAF